MQEDRSFAAELARRKVYRAGLTYVVVILALWGGVEIASQAFGWSDGVLRLVIVVSLAMLPVVLIASWLFDVAIDWSSGMGRALIGGLGMAFGLVAAVVLMLGSGLLVTGVPPLGSTLQYRLALPEHAQLDDESRPRIALSPDGQQLLYKAAAEGERSHLWLLSRDELTPRPFVGTEGAVNPVFSPDGASFAFSRTRLMAGGQELVAARLDAVGDLRVLATSEVGLDGLSWGEDGFVYFDGLTGGSDVGIMRVEAGGGNPEQVTTIDRGNGESDHIWPHALPDGQGVLFTVVRSADLSDADIAVSDLTGAPHRVVARGVSSAYAATGHALIVTLGGELIARRFDPETLSISGPELPVATGLSVRLNGRTDLALSENGRMAYTTGQASSSGAELVTVDFEGRIEPIEGAVPTNHRELAVSPDGSRVAYVDGGVTNSGDDTEIWVKELDGGPPVRITSFGGRTGRPTWSPDGQYVLFHSGQLEGRDILSTRADGLGSAEPVLAGPTDYLAAAFSPGGEYLVHLERSESRATLWASRVDGEEPPTQLLESSGVNAPLGAISPNGRWLAYTESASGDPFDADLIVRSFPDVGAFRRTLSGDGFEPMWSDDGRTLYFVDSARQMTAIDLAAGPEFREVGRRVLFRLDDRIVLFPGRTHLIPGGDLFLMVRAPSSVVARELVVVEGLFEMLTRLERD